MARGGAPEPADTPSRSQLEAAAAVFDMLSVPTRLHLMWMLCHGDYDVGSLAAAVDANIAAVSQHLAKLRMVGLVSAHRRGRHQVYTADDPHILLLVEQVFEHIVGHPGQDNRTRTDKRSHQPSL
ncbi:MAG: metalloregulator ArsR/SmtB family transcription factor [Actinocatenispora sp.]